uniref:Uncharacterized protein n=1 Tax=Ignisphaera aggregans TaxID=334771 RepID=A0A7J2U1W4_9CREN
MVEGFLKHVVTALMIRARPYLFSFWPLLRILLLFFKSTGLEDYSIAAGIADTTRSTGRRCS